MDASSILNAALAGRYVVEREIGRGGMATVYLARDLRHDRKVALKVLDPELGAVLGAERFLSEIRVTANLQHPNLLPLFDSGESDGLLWYVMPYVEGETLRARLTRERQLPIDEAVHIAAAVAGALDYAHQHGVIHRDLKPENILLHAGEPVVADFGIALAVSKAGGPRVTQTGLSLGTPQYMSPEQATGDRQIDGRADIYSLGAVCYEMLTGDPPHTGSTVQAIVARVLTERPASARVARPAVPEHVALAVERALEKLPADRWATARELADALQGRTTVARAREAARRPPTLRERARDPVAVALAATTVLALAAAAIVAARAGHEPPPGPVRFSIVTPKDAELINATYPLAIAPDGRSIVYVGLGASATRQLYIRTLAELRPRSIPGTESAITPFFSPDGAWIGYVQPGGVGAKLMRVAVAGGPPIEITQLPHVGDATWTRDGRILFTSDGALFTVPAAGGAPKPLTRPDTARGETGQHTAVVLGDGKTIVYASVPKTGVNDARLAVTTLDGDRSVLLDIKAIAALGMVDRQLVYVQRDGAIMAVPFDVRRRVVTGPAVAVGQGVLVIGRAVMAALSANGTLVYGGGTREAELLWVDEHGATRPVFDEKRLYDRPRLSPDGKRLAVQIGSPTPPFGDYWTYDFSAATLSRLTTDSASYNGEWSADGRDFVFSHGRDTSPAIWRQPVDGSGPPAAILDDKKFHYFALGPDGRSLVYTEFPTKNGDGVLMVRGLAGDTTPRRLASFPGGEWSYRFSPDGRWLAYMSYASGAEEVYVRPYPGPGPRVQVSANGGIEPVWAPDGKRLFYRDRGGKTMFAAAVSTTPTFTVLGRTKLFEGNFDVEWDVADYDVSRDGKQLLMVRKSEENRELVVTVNWGEELRRRLKPAR